MPTQIELSRHRRTLHHLMKDVEILIQNDITLLRCNALEWKNLQESRHRGVRFSLTFPHGLAKNAKRNSVVLISVSGDAELPEQLKIGLVKSVQAVATFTSRVLIDLVADLDEQALENLVAKVTDSSLKSSVSRFIANFEQFEKISDKLGRRLIELLLENPQNAASLRQIIWQLDLPKRNVNARALQIDALRLALKAFGATDTLAVERKLYSSETALAGVHLHEDAVIEHDAREIDDWTLEQSKATGWARFIKGSGRDVLEVFTANKRPLEELFGVDLIYLNKNRESLVMVQYKMLEGARTVVRQEDAEFEEKEWSVHVDEQFKSELVRMTKFDKDADSNSDYRLNPTSFFFKLVKRDAETKSAGIILSREHLQFLIDSGTLDGPKGGLKIGFRQLNGHYIRSSGFVELIRSGYIGSRGATTKHLKQLVDLTLSEGRAAVGVVQAVLKHDPSRHSYINDIFHAFEPDPSLAPPGWSDQDEIEF